MSIPEDTYDTIRRQYYSSLLLSKIHGYVRESWVYRVLGITDVDLYVPRLNFVFGEAHNLLGVAVISVRRLRPEFYGHPPDKRLFLERCAKESIHEIGHTLGLGHCDNSRCVMFFSNDIQTVDAKDPQFCRECGIQLKSRL